MPDSNPDVEPEPYLKLMSKPDLDPNNAEAGSGSVKIISDPQIGYNTSKKIDPIL
jgi:hypothetical protein